jgi:hypothetical protein
VRAPTRFRNHKPSSPAVFAASDHPRTRGGTDVSRRRQRVDYFEVVHLTLDSDAKRNGLSEADFHVFAKLFEEGLERRFEAEAFSRGQIGGHDDVLDVLVGDLINVDMARQPAP